jgi:vancomycin permeability regulator SanA
MTGWWLATGVTDLEQPSAAAKETRPTPSRRRWLRRSALVLGVAAGLAVVVVVGCVAWTRIESSGRIHSVGQAPQAPVVVVLGAQLAPGGTEPMPFLAGRLDVAAQLVTTGRARTVLVSGDAAGGSGNEIVAMTNYLRRRGVPARSIMADPYGLDSYDTCARAARVYGIRRALLVSQAYHLPRTVTLCRRVGIDAHGVKARCDGCRNITLIVNTAREALANVKAVPDAIRRPPPAVTTGAR